MKRVLYAAVLLAAVMLAAPVQADESRDLERLASMFRAKEPGKMLEWLKMGIVDVDEDNISLARKACAMLERYARATTLANDGDGTTSALIEWFEEKAEKILKKSPKKPSAYRAKAYVLSARAKCEIAAVRFKGPGPWEECATLCLKAAELSKTKKALYTAHAVGYYNDWYPHAGDRQAEVQKLARDTAKQGLASHPDDPYLKAAVGNSYLAEAQAHVAAKRKGPAKKTLQAALEALEPSGELPKGPKGSEQAGAYNHVLTFALANKIRVKGEYIASEKNSSEWQICYPRGTGWKYAVGGGFDGVWNISRDTDWGKCRILMNQYSWDTLYGEAEVGGDNTTGVAEHGSKEMLGSFSKIDKHKKKIKGKLNRQTKKTAGYDIRGLDEDDEPFRVRGWYFKGCEHRKTYALLVMWWGDAPAIDPEVDFILKKLREREKK